MRGERLLKAGEVLTAARKNTDDNRRTWKIQKLLSCFFYFPSCMERIYAQDNMNR